MTGGEGSERNRYVKKLRRSVRITVYAETTISPIQSHKRQSWGRVCAHVSCSLLIDLHIRTLRGPDSSEGGRYVLAAEDREGSTLQCCKWTVSIQVTVDRTKIRHVSYIVQEKRVKRSYNQVKMGSTCLSGLLADVFDLFFTPIPQLLLGVDVGSLRVWKRGACKGGDIL